MAALLMSVVAMAQDETPPYPQDYFRNPLDIPIFLAGNFGECRPGHFHSGTDIKTLGKENQPVHAAAQGYISRIKMEKGGFGHALYITHPNGYTTLYAHLNEFAPELQAYLKKKQYEQRRWDVDLELRPEQFPVKKGSFIAYSGNTGASTAPHLHFEIRNTKTEHPLNPELFGLPIEDHVQPLPTEVVLYEGDPLTFYNDHTVTLPLAKKGDTYKPTKSIDPVFKLKGDTILTLATNTGIGININDYMEGSDNTIAFYTAKLYVNDSLQSEIILDDIGYDETRYINAYADYKTKELNDKWIQLLFKLPGNGLGHIYHHLNNDDGRITLRDSNPAKVTIEITDDRKNKTVIGFYLQAIADSASKTFTSDCTPADSNYCHFNTPHTWSCANVNFTWSAGTLYDDVCLKVSTVPYSDGYSDQYRIQEPWVPMHKAMPLRIKPKKPIPFDLRSKVVMMYSDDHDKDGRAATAVENGWYESHVRNFGTYWLETDTTAPVIKSLQKDNANLSKARQITFQVADNKTSVHSFEGLLDGKWICFEQHNGLFFYKFDEHCLKGKHTLVFRATDENGNESSFHYHFTR